MITEVIKFEDTQWLSDLQSGSDLLKELAENTENFSEIGEKEFKSLQQVLSKYEKSLDKANKQVEKGNRKFNKQRSILDALKKPLGGAANGIKVFGISYGDVVDTLESSRSNFKGLITNLKGSTIGFKSLGKAIIATGIGALVIALIALAQAFSRTQKGMETVTRVMAVLDSLTDVYINRALKLKDVFVSLFSGRPLEAIKNYRDIWRGLGKDIVEAAKSADDFTKRGITLRKEQTDLRVEFARQRAEIERLKLAGEDVTKGIEERKQAFQSAFNIENSSKNKRIQ